MNPGSGLPASSSSSDSNRQSATLLNTLLLQTALQQNPLNVLLGQLTSQPQPAQSPAVQTSQPDNAALMNSIAGMLLGAQQGQPLAVFGNRPASIAGDSQTNGALVGSTGDEEEMVKALAECERRGQTYRQVLESLHGVNNHTASQWKDYYLDHAARINRLIAIRQGKPPMTVKKPNFDSMNKDNQNVNGPRRVSAPLVKENSNPPSTSTSARKDAKSSEDLASFTTKRSSNLPIDIPSRSPTPPTDVVRRGRGYLYTEEEKKWFIQYVKYRYNEDHNLKKVELCEELTRKLPHHNAGSWMAHWSLHRKIYDVQFAPITGKKLSDDEESSDDESPLSRQTKGKQTSSAYNSHSSGRSDSSSDEDTDSEEDRRNMAPARQPLLKADKRVVARYIASHPEHEWNSLRGSERWTPFAKMFPQRDWHAWSEIVRKYNREVDVFVRKYRRRQKDSLPLQDQVAKPTWAIHKERSSSATTKRQHSDEADMTHLDLPAAKRARPDSQASPPRSSPQDYEPAHPE